MTNKITVVTGAAGFIGSHLVDHLLTQGIKPQNLRLLVAPWAKLDNLNHLPLDEIELIKVDIRDRKKVKDALQGAEYVYHLAAKIDFLGQNYDQYYQVNVQGTQNLIDACQGQKIKKFILYSSIAVFGLPAGIGQIESWAETHPKTFTNWYGLSKWETEQRLIKAHSLHKLPYAIIRPASVYGPREKGPTLAFCQAIKNKRFAIIGSGQNLMHYVYVKDLVAGTYQAAQSQQNRGDYILAGPQPITLQKLAQLIAQELAVGLPSWRLPKVIALPAAYLLQLLGAVFGFKPPLFPSRVRTMTTNYYYDLSKAPTPS